MFAAECFVWRARLGGWRLPARNLQAPRCLFHSHCQSLDMSFSSTTFPFPSIVLFLVSSLLHFYVSLCLSAWVDRCLFMSVYLSACAGALRLVAYRLHRGFLLGFGLSTLVRHGRGSHLLRCGSAILRLQRAKWRRCSFRLLQAKLTRR